jgi:MHS family proline/betaine transporter-like MFS transporter
MLLGASSATLVTNMMSDSSLISWGWRLPFLFSGVLGTTAILLRRQLPESAVFMEHEQNRPESSPIKEALFENRRETLQGILFASGYGAVYYLAMVYLPTWLFSYEGLLLKEAIRINVLGTAVLMVLTPIMGWVSDRFIRRTHFIAVSMLMFACLSIPCLKWMGGASILSIIVTQTVFAALIAVPAGVGPAMFAELFPTSDRLSGYSISFNIGMGMVGGSTPAIVTWLIAVTGRPLTAAIYMTIGALVSLVALLWMKDRSREALR